MRAAACCPGLPLLDDLRQRIGAQTWLLDSVHAVGASGLPDAWVGAGVVRDVVWGGLAGGFDPARVHDVDVAFFDSHDLSRRRDEDATQQLGLLLARPWEASNQAAVHTWYHRYFGGDPVAAFTRVHDAVATWPEIATCVALRATPQGIEVCAPHGLDDLVGGIWRRNPTRVSIDVSRARLARHHPAERWPAVTVVTPVE